MNTAWAQTEEEINKQRRAAGFFDKAQKFFEENDFERAIIHYKKAIELEPKDANLFNNLGTAYAKKNDLLGAEQAYQTALGLNRSHKVALLNASQVLIQRGFYRKAEHWLKRLKALYPQEAAIYPLLGVAYFHRGKYLSSVQAYEKVLGMGALPKQGAADIYNNLGVSLTRLGEMEKAKQVYMKALELRSDHPLALRNLKILQGNEETA